MNKLIYISAAWCGPCKQFGPVMNRVAETIPVQKVDADADTGLPTVTPSRTPITSNHPADFRA